MESKYRVKPSRDQRAIAGLSIGWRHLDKFSAAVPQGFEKDFEAALATKDATNSKLKGFWIGCGKDDSLFERNEKFAAMLASKGIHNTWRATEGNHTYPDWRKYLAEFAPLLFR